MGKSTQISSQSDKNNEKNSSVKKFPASSSLLLMSSSKLFHSLDTYENEDQLFLLPDVVLNMDSISFREDVQSVAPNFLSTKHSPHNSLDSSSDSSKSLRLVEDREGLKLARASNDCRTLWLCDSRSSLMIEDSETSALMTTSLMSTLRPLRRHQFTRSRGDLNVIQREREERIRRLKETQEEDRRRKLEELKIQAAVSQKFREAQEIERRKHIEELRLRDFDKRLAVEERRKALEEAENERRVALFKRNKEREERLEVLRRGKKNGNGYAFGSSTPRMIQPSVSDIWGARSRSNSSTNVSLPMSQSMYSNRRSLERELTDSGKKRATSAIGLDRSEGEEIMVTQYHVSSSAHRRRTDLIPTLPSRPCPSPGLSRESTATISSSRPQSVNSSESFGVGVKMRNGSFPSRRPRPLSIATTGIMSSSQWEKRQNGISGLPDSTHRSSQKCLTPDGRNKRAKSANVADEDSKSTSSLSNRSFRKTPAQVKAESNARKTSKITTTNTNTPPSKNLGNINYQRPSPSVYHCSQAPSLSGSQKSLLEEDDFKNEHSAPYTSPINEFLKEESGVVVVEDEGVESVKSDYKKSISNNNVNNNNNNNNINDNNKKEELIAKAKLAEKRREMKEKKEREAEMERLRLAEEEREEAEKRRREEEEEEEAIKEAEKLVMEARQVEEERLRRAIQEVEKIKEFERKKCEEEEKLKIERDELEKRKQEELAEKLRKEEEERNLRKRRINEIMARTRKTTGADNNNLLKNTMETQSLENNDGISSNVSVSNHSNSDVVKHYVLEENAKNSNLSLEKNSSFEKSVRDTQIINKNDDPSSDLNIFTTLKNDNDEKDYHHHHQEQQNHHHQEDTHLEPILDLSKESSTPSVKGLPKILPSMQAFDTSIHVPNTSDVIS